MQNKIIIVMKGDSMVRHHMGFIQMHPDSETVPEKFFCSNSGYFSK